MKFDLNVFSVDKTFEPGPVFNEMFARYLPDDCTVNWFDFQPCYIVRIGTDKGTFIFSNGRLFGVEVPKK